MFLIFIKASLASFSYALLLDVRGRALFAASANGGVAWMVYQALSAKLTSLLAYFIASLVFSLGAEILARFLKKPASIFLVVALLPLVPGQLIYNTMSQLASKGQTTVALENLSLTFAIAMALSLGILIVSTLAKMYNQKHT